MGKLIRDARVDVPPPLSQSFFNSREICPTCTGWPSFEVSKVAGMAWEDFYILRQVRPSRARSSSASFGPQLPDGYSHTGGGLGDLCQACSIWSMKRHAP